MAVSVAYILMQMPVPSEVFLAVEVNALIRAGMQVEVFCLRPPHAQHDKLLSDQELTNVPIHFFRWFVLRDIFYCLRRSPGILSHMLVLIIRSCWKRPLILIKSLAILPKSFSIARAIEQDQLSIVHAAWGHYPAITAYLIKRAFGVQFTLALGAYDRVMRHPMTVVAAEQATCILTQSKTSAALLTREWPMSSTPVFVTKRGVDLESIRSSSDIIVKVPGLIASVGRLIEAKGHQHVLRAFEKVRSVIPHSRLIILGEGSYRRQLEQLVRGLGLTDSVEFAGHVPQSELFRRISECSVFVLASESKTDNLPNSVKEAMAMGIPVITTPTTGVSELVEDGETGLIVPMGDVQAIGAALILLLNDKDYAARLAKQAVESVKQNFDIRRTTNLRRHLYENLFHWFSTSSDFTIARDELPVGATEGAMKKARARIRTSQVSSEIQDY